MAFLVKKGTFTQSGGPFSSQAVTGVGFQPTAILFWASPPAAMSPGSFVDGSHLAWGWCEASSVSYHAQPGLNAAAADNESGETTVRSGDVTYAINVAGLAADPIIVLQAQVSSLDTDGFTLYYNTVDLREGYFAGSVWHYLAFGGDVEAWMASSTTAGESTGTETLSLGMSAAFTPAALLGWTIVSSAAARSYQLGLGMAGLDVSTLTQGALAAQTEQGANPSNTYRYQRSDQFLVGLAGTGNTVRKAGALTAIASNSITVDWATAAASEKLALLALGGTNLRGEVVAFTQPASPGTQTVSTSMEPLAVILMSAGGVASSTVQNGYGVSLGASDGTSQGVAWSGDLDAQAPSISASYQDTAAIFLAATPAATASGSTLTGKASLTALTPGGFTLNWTTTDGTAREILALAIGAEGDSRRNFLTGTGHSVQGSDNLIAGMSGTISGNQNALFALCTESPTPAITGSQTFKVCADTIDLDATTVTINGAPPVTGPDTSTDEALARFNGTGGDSLQNSLITVSDTGVLGLPDDVRQTFNPGTTNAGLNVGSLAGDPSSPADGDLWYDATAEELTARINGANVALGAGGGGSLDGLTDVALGSPVTDGDVLTYVSGAWTNSAPIGGVGLVLLEEHTASSSASLDFTTWYSSSYDEYMIECLGLVPATNDVTAQFRFSTNGGSSYDSGTNYAGTRFVTTTAGGTSAAGGTAETSVIVTPNVTNTSTAGLHGTFRLYDPANTALYKTVFGHTHDLDFGGSYSFWQVSSIYKVTTAVNAFQFLFSSGNITSGTMRVYGFAK